MSLQAYNYVKFDEKEVNLFLNLLDIEKQNIISFNDVESACRQLGLAESFPKIKNLLKELVTTQDGEIPVKELRDALLKKDQKTSDELIEIFRYIDYDDKREITKNKLKIMIKELTGESISDLEAEGMIALIKNEHNIVDLKSFLKLADMKINV